MASLHSYRLARRSSAILARSCEAGGRLRQRHGLIVKGKRISCPPHYAPPNNDYEHGFPLIRSLRASAQRSTSGLFSFVLSLLIMAGSFTVRQSKTILSALLGTAKWQRIGDEIKAAFIFAGSDFVNVHMEAWTRQPQRWVKIIHLSFGSRYNLAGLAVCCS